jgi:hypothetical protein
VRRRDGAPDRPLESSDALDRYLATAQVPAVAEMLAMHDAQAPRIVEVAEYG